MKMQSEMTIEEFRSVYASKRHAGSVYFYISDIIGDDVVGWLADEEMTLDGDEGVDYEAGDNLSERAVTAKADAFISAEPKTYNYVTATEVEFR